jgi:hypothetical protein
MKKAIMTEAGTAAQPSVGAIAIGNSVSQMICRAWKTRINQTEAIHAYVATKK